MITLKPGDKGPEVAVLQTWLAAVNPGPGKYSVAATQVSAPDPRLETVIGHRSKETEIYPPSSAALEVTGEFDRDTEVALARMKRDHLVMQGDLLTVDHNAWWQLAQLVRTKFVANPPGTPQWLWRLGGPMVMAPHSIGAARFLEGYAELFGSSKGAAGLQTLLAYINADAALTDIRWAAYMLATVHCECGPGHDFAPVAEDGCDDSRRPVCTPLKNGNQRSYGDPVYCPPDLPNPFLNTTPTLAKLERLIPPPPLQPPYQVRPDPDAKWKPKPFKCPAGKTFHTYYGRGYVQLTGAKNYERMSNVTGQDLVHFPERAMDPDTAYRIMSHGMRNGTFTGVRLSKFISASTCNYFDARTIINGHDRASTVEDWAKRYEIILYYSLA